MITRFFQRVCRYAGVRHGVGVQRGDRGSLLRLGWDRVCGEDLVQLFQRDLFRLRRLQALQHTDFPERSVHERPRRVYFCALRPELTAVDEFHALGIIEGVIKTFVSRLDVQIADFIQQIKTFRLSEGTIFCAVPLILYRSGLPRRHGPVPQFIQQPFADPRRP